MTPEEKAAYINSQVASAMIEALGMQAMNMQRAAVGQSMAYVDDDFFELEKKYCIGHNDVLAYLGK